MTWQTVSGELNMKCDLKRITIEQGLADPTSLIKIFCFIGDGRAYKSAGQPPCTGDGCDRVRSCRGGCVSADGDTRLAAALTGVDGVTITGPEKAAT